MARSGRRTAPILSHDFRRCGVVLEIFPKTQGGNRASLSLSVAPPPAHPRAQAGMFDRETRREKNLVKLAKSVAKRAKREAADAAAAAKKSSSSQSSCGRTTARGRSALPRQRRRAANSS